MTTQAELWVRFLKLRTDNAPALTQLAVKQIVDQLHADYPHRIVHLTCSGKIIGTRRIFLADRSYADQYLNDKEQKIEIGTLTDGRVGIAHNGKPIDDLH